MRVHVLTRGRRGSALLIALMASGFLFVVCSVILQRTTTEAKLANSHRVYNLLQSAAEAQLDMAVSTFANHYRLGSPNGLTWTGNTTAAWTGWSTSRAANTKMIDLGEVAIGDGHRAHVRAWVRGIPDGSTPINGVAVAYAEAELVTGPSAGAKRQVSIGLRRNVSLISTAAILTKTTMTGNGSISVDSYKSSQGDYSTATRRPNGSVVSASTAEEVVGGTAPLSLTGRNEIFGYVKTGADDPSNNLSNSHVYLKTSQQDPSYQYAKTGVDPDALQHDYKTTFMDPVSPSTAGASTLTYDSQGQGGFMVNGRPVTKLTAGTYVLSQSVNLSGNASLSIEGNVKIVMPTNSRYPNNAAFAPALNISGNAGFNLLTGSTLEIHTAGNLNLSGNVATGATNPNQVKIFGMGPINPTAQSGDTARQLLAFSGNIDFVGLIYVPNARFENSGNTRVKGAVVAYNAKLNGNVSVHYDEDTVVGETSLGYVSTAWAEKLGTGADVYPQ